MYEQIDRNSDQFYEPFNYEIIKADKLRRYSMFENNETNFSHN